MLQSSMNSETPEQLLPPFTASILTSLVLVLFPPPHFFEQTPIVQEPHSQSTVQRSRLYLQINEEKDSVLNLNLVTI